MRQSFGKPFDIREYKNMLRRRYKAIRRNIKPELKAEKDRLITSAILDMPQYKSAETLLTYVSTSEEVDTRELIRISLEMGKRVAVPYCVEGTRDMDFYLIGGIGELVPRTYGILEPVPEKSCKLTNFDGSICVLPGLAFDGFGYRLGYGGGYYDRFLQKTYTGVTVGIYYWALSARKLIHGRYDAACDFLVTENGVRRRLAGGKG